MFKTVISALILLLASTTAFACGQENDYANIYNQQGQLIVEAGVNPMWMVNEYNVRYLLVESNGSFVEIYGNPIVEPIKVFHRNADGLID